MYRFGNFNLKRPRTKTGEATYYKLLKEIKRGTFYSNLFNDQKNMTFQALKEAGLITYKNKYTKKSQFILSDAGSFYINYVESTNKPLVKVLKAITNY